MVLAVVAKHRNVLLERKSFETWGGGGKKRMRMGEGRSTSEFHFLY